MEELFVELIEVFELIQTTFAASGFKLYDQLRNSATRSCFVRDDELDRVRIADSNYTAFSGMCIEVRIAPHRNQAKEDTSYYVAIEDVSRSSFKDYKKIKLMRSQTEQTLVKKLQKLIREYDEMLADRKLGAQIEAYLNKSPDAR